VSSRQTPVLRAGRSRFVRRSLPDWSSHGRESPRKHAGMAAEVALIRESEKGETEERQDEYSRNPRTREASERGPRCSAKRSKGLYSSGVTRTDACSLGANAPLCASSAGSCELRAALCLAALGAARSLATRGYSLERFREESEGTSRACAIDGRAWVAGGVVDDGARLAVYVQITSTSTASQQSLMLPALGVPRGRPCTPHCTSVGVAGVRGRHV